MSYFKEQLQKQWFKRLFIIFMLFLLLYLMKNLFNLILISFIFIYLMNRLHVFIISVLKRHIKVNPLVVTIIMYLAIAGIFTFGVYKLLPILITQSTQLINQAIYFYNKPTTNELMNYIKEIIQNSTVSGYLSQGVSFIFQSFTNISQSIFNIAIAFLLSLFFLLGKNNIIDFTKGFKYNKFAFLYSEIEYLGRKFMHSFGKVIEAQIIIAFVTAILTTIFLLLMNFPQILILSIIVFVLGLIPVVGSIVALLPLCITAFTIGGITKVIYLLILDGLLQLFIGYVLGPKLMSSIAQIPVFYTIIVLIISQHFLGVWGLLLGIPIFSFIMDESEIDDK
jgi:predicted PurR-regulated permease PerM